MIACGLDFGTSNSAIGVARNGEAELAPIEDANTLMPSAVFFDYETKGRVVLGNAAISAYVEQTEGRLMRAHRPGRHRRRSAPGGPARRR